MSRNQIKPIPVNDMSRSRIFVSINDSITSPQNFQIQPNNNYVKSFICRFACCCKPCYKSSPSTPGPFSCERKGCNNLHGNWNAGEQRKEWEVRESEDGLPGIGWSGFCSYNCAMQTYFEIKYDLCCLSAGKPVDTSADEFNSDLPCICCFTLCCTRQMYDPADERLLKAGRQVEIGGGHCCCYTAFPNWAQNTESLEPTGVVKLVENIAKRNLTDQEIADGVEISFGNDGNSDPLQDMKKVISEQVLASEIKYDEIFTDDVKQTAASFRTLEGRSKKPLQDVSTIFQLYEQARELEILLKDFLNNAGVDPNKMKGGDSSTSVKGIRRAMTKINMGYGLNILQLTDVCRGSLMFQNIANMGQALAWMLDHPDEILVLRIKNRFLEGRAAPGGYRDVLVNCRFPNDPHRHVFEVQLHLEAYHRLKKGGGGHKVYKIARFVDAIGPTSSYSLLKRIQGENWNEATHELYQRLVEHATGDAMHHVFEVLESQEFLGSIRGEQDIKNTMMCIMMLVGNGIALEMKAGTMTKREIVTTDCPLKPENFEESMRKDMDSVILERWDKVNASMIALVVEIGKVLSPVILSTEIKVDKNILDCESLIRKQFDEKDWMLQNMVSNFDTEFAQMLDNNASGSSSIGELENAIKSFCYSFVVSEKKLEREAAAKIIKQEQETKKNEDLPAEKII